MFREQITETQVIKLILQTEPNFATNWQQHLEYWGEDEVGLCIDIDVFSDFVIQLIKDDMTQKLPEIFELIENFMKNGTERVKDAVATCFLENILSAVSREEISSTAFTDLLGDESQAYCTEWNKFTAS